MSDTPEKPHRTGAFWLDFVVAIAAVGISLISLWVASRADRTQERLLAASVWPYVEFSTSNFRNEVRAVDLSLDNAGVGPARIRWMTLAYQGKPVKDARQLLSACCDRSGAHVLVKGTITSTVSHSVLTPHEERDFVSVPYTASLARDYNQLDRSARHQLHVQVCYCSVLDDCWLLDNKATEEDPKPVSNCSQVPANAYEG